MRSAEQFIEQIAEPLLEHLDLCLRDRNGARRSDDHICGRVTEKRVSDAVRIAVRQLSIGTADPAKSVIP